MVKDGGLDERTVGRSSGWKDGRLDGRAVGRTDGWTDGRLDGWMDGRLDRTAVGRTHGCIIFWGNFQSEKYDGASFVKYVILGNAECTE